MQNPKQLSTARLRKLVRCFCGTSVASICVAYQGDRQDAVVWVDADWSGTAETCKSTSSRATQIEHTVETWSVNQKVISLSSAKREFYASGSGADNK